MTATLNCPVLGLDEEWPEELFLVRSILADKYACWCHQGVLHGLATFKSGRKAGEFMDMLDDHASMILTAMRFDDAREVARRRPLPVSYMMLLDDIEKPLIHFVPKSNEQ